MLSASVSIGHHLVLTVSNVVLTSEVLLIQECQWIKILNYFFSVLLAYIAKANGRRLVSWGKTWPVAAQIRQW